MRAIDAVRRALGFADQWILGHVTVAEGRTVGQAVITVALHQAFHNGEATVARRASGQRPAFVPSGELREF